MNHFVMECPGHPEATLEAFLLTDELHYGKGKKRPAVVVCPGGGYLYCSPREGEPVALSYMNAGFHSFVLRYSVGWKAAGFAPLEELSWAIGYIREHAEQWNIDPEKIAACGFSAGGHLVLASGLQAENKPNAMILGYPATSAPNLPGMDFMLKVLTGREEVTDADARRFDLVPQITKAAPPAFFVATSQDPLTQYGALSAASAYGKLGMQYELHVFQFGGHGFSLATPAAADGSSRKLDAAFSLWQMLSVHWLNRIFGAPEFEDKEVGSMIGYMKQMGFIPADDPREKLL